MSEEYVLGNDQEELSRLKLQHDLWHDELLKLWQQTSLKSAEKILDLGCGPGYTTLDLLNYNNSHQVKLTSVDISDSFIDYLNYQLQQRNLRSRVRTQGLSLYFKSMSAMTVWIWFRTIPL